MERPVRLIIVEDCPEDVEIIVDHLRREGMAIHFQSVQTEAELADLLDGDWDAVLSDYSLPVFSAKQALRIVKERDPWMPFIVVSGMISESNAIEMMRLGANDYVFKDSLLRLRPALKRELVDTGRMRKGQQRSELLDAIITSTQDAIFSEDMAGVVTSWNPGAERLLGWDADEILSTCPTLSTSVGEGKTYDDLRTLAIEGGKPQHSKTVLLTRSGHAIWVTMTVSPIRDINERIVGVSAIAQDYTSQQISLDEKQRVSTLLEAIVDGTPDAVFAKDLEGRYLLFNEAAARFVGCAAADVLGKRDAEVFDAKDAETILQSDRSVIASGEPLVREEVLQGVDGERIFLASKAPLRNRSGETIGLLGISRDITDRKKAEEQLAEQEAMLEEAVEIARIGYWNRDAINGRLTWSRRLYSMFGVDSESFEHSFDSLLELIHPEDRERVRARVTEAEKHGEVFDHTYRVPVNGKVHVIHEVGRATLGDQGELLSISGTAQDITREWNREQALRQSEARFRAFMDNSPATAWMTDVDGRMLYASEAYKRAFKLPHQNLEGKTVFDLFPQELADLYLANIRAVASSGSTVKASEAAIAADGSMRELLVYKFPVPGLESRTHIGGIAIDVTDWRKAESELHLRDRAIQSLQQGVLIIDPSKEGHPIIYASPGFERITGYSQEECIGKSCRFLQGPESDLKAVQQIEEAVKEGQSYSVEILNYRKDGSTFWNDLSVSPVRDSQEKITHFVCGLIDVTQRRRLEEQVRQAQKMEAVGQLAGGIAHDFNNLLTIINGYCDFVLEELADDHPCRSDLTAIRTAGERSAELTRQLLAYGRRQVLNPRVLDLNDVVAEVGTLVKRIIGEDVSFELRPPEDVWQVKADRGQIEQVILNLIVNARDAMPDGGRITVRVFNRDLHDRADEINPDANRKKYVCVAVEDTGDGMSQELQSRIFEPFFTTKTRDKGSGLGLSVVQGIIRQSEGYLTVDSALGMGTTMEVCLPAFDSIMEQPAATNGNGASGGYETILLVEDEPGLRSLTRRMLESRGYLVLEAATGHEAIEYVEAEETEIDLLIADVVMPEMGGPAVAQQIRQRNPDVRVLFISGYADDKSLREDVSRNDADFLPKPYTTREIGLKVREILDRGRE